LKNQQIKPLLPSDRKFGLFFSSLFVLLSFYFFIVTNYFWLIIFITLSIITVFTSYFFSSYLHIFNMGWFKLGSLLNKIISPIILGFIFFFIFTPLGIIMRFFGRDELKLKKRSCSTYWINKTPQDFQKDSFKNQF